MGLKEAVGGESHPTSDVEYVHGFGRLESQSPTRKVNLLRDGVPQVLMFVLVDLRLEFMESHVHGSWNCSGEHVQQLRYPISQLELSISSASVLTL